MLGNLHARLRRGRHRFSVALCALAAAILLLVTAQRAFRATSSSATSGQQPRPLLRPLATAVSANDERTLETVLQEGLPKGRKQLLCLVGIQVCAKPGCHPSPSCIARLCTLNWQPSSSGCQISSINHSLVHGGCCRLPEADACASALYISCNATEGPLKDLQGGLSGSWLDMTGQLQTLWQEACHLSGWCPPLHLGLLRVKIADWLSDSPLPPCLRLLLDDPLRRPACPCMQTALFLADSGSCIQCVCIGPLLLQAGPTAPRPHAPACRLAVSCLKHLAACRLLLLTASPQVVGPTCTRA